MDYDKLKELKTTYCGQSPWCEEDHCRCDEWEDAESEKIFGGNKIDK